MTLYEAVSLAKKMMAKHPELRYWKVTINNRKKSFGVCSYSKKEIQLSRFLTPVCKDEAIVDTIIHEIAHALTPGHNHDIVWMEKCIELGGNGKRCGGSENYKDDTEGKVRYQEKTAKYTLTCPVCGAVFFRNRRPSGLVSCGKHGSRAFDLKYKLILKQNY